MDPTPLKLSAYDVSTSAPAPIVDPEVLPQGPITRSKAKQFREAVEGPITRSKAKQFREALFLTCAKLSDSFDINCALEHKCVTVLHTDVEIKGHDIRDLSLARLKFRSSYAARPSDEPEGQTPSLQVEAIIRELKKSFREELEPIHDRLERLEGSQTNTPEEDHAENGSDQTPNQRQNPRQGRVQQVDDNLTNIKIAIPSFQGRTDPDAEIKGHDIRDLSLARLKFRSSYAARFSSTKCHTSAS
ncbi:hypothetical protein GQ457_01G020460 [Hibiscus cannabinus]